MAFMAFNLAKFFHRASGSDDRKLLLSRYRDVNRWKDVAVVTFAMDGQDKECMREDFADTHDAIAAFQKAAAEFRAAGYFETEQTNYLLSALPPRPVEKPAWQRDLDELYLAMLLEAPAKQSPLIEVLTRTPAQSEPFYLMLVAECYSCNRPDDPAGALRRAQAAWGAFCGQADAREYGYRWSLDLDEYRTELCVLLSHAHYAVGDFEAAESWNDSAPL